ncbi:MAG: hypothetical protein RLN79_03680 [Cytophagales bacterium]
MNSDYFKNLSEREQNKINNAIRKKEFKLILHDESVEFLHWNEVYLKLNFRENIFNEIYNYLSLHAHPSNVAVFQFDGIFDTEHKHYLRLAYTNLRYAFMMSSVFITEYLNLFPELMKYFNQISIPDQILLNFHNTVARGEKYSINDTWKILGTINE